MLHECYCENSGEKKTQLKKTVQRFQTLLEARQNIGQSNVDEACRRYRQDKGKGGVHRGQGEIGNNGADES